jgi:hypothetical protein
MGVIGEDLLNEIKEADERDDGDRLIPLLEYAYTLARENFYLKGGKVIRSNDLEYLPTSQRNEIFSKNISEIS